MNSDAFDGVAINPTLPLKDASAFEQQFGEAANSAANLYNELSVQEKKSAPGKILLAQIKEHLDNARKLKGAMFNHRVLLHRRIATATNMQQADKKRQHEAAVLERREREQRSAETAALLQTQRASAAPACAAFESDVMTRRNRNGMVPFLDNPDTVTADYQRLSSFLKLSKNIAAQCTKPAYSAIVQTSCSDSPAKDPKAWCQAATTAQSTLRNHLLRKSNSWETIAENRYMSADELERNNGWIRIENPTSLERTLSFDRMMYVNDADFGPDKQRELLIALDIEAEDFLHYEASLDYINELREAIEEGADSWPEVARATASKDNAYGTRLAANQIIERWHPNAKIKEAWLSRANWKIIKNNLGVILRRTLPGHVLFQLPEDPYCQLRSFTLTEQYTGSGTFQSAKGVRFGYVRFQKCD